MPPPSKKERLTPAEKSLRAKIAALESWAFTPDRAARTQAARSAFMAKFERQVDPEGLLPPEERAKRAECARQAHFLRMNLARLEKRRAEKAGS